MAGVNLALMPVTLNTIFWLTIGQLRLHCWVAMLQCSVARHEILSSVKVNGMVTN